MSIYTGTVAADELYGYVGDDEFYGLEGDDLLSSVVAPEDLMSGDSDKDTMDGGSGNDTLNGGFDNDSLLGGDGNDFLDGGSDYKIQNYIGDDETGFPMYEYFLIKGGKDILDGGVGVDTMKGGSGDDLYIVDDVGDVVIELADEGIDVVQSSVSYTLGINVEHLTLVGTANINGTGNNLNNILNDNAGNNVLDGAAGNDILVATAGQNTLIGGQGNDDYIFTITDTIVIEQQNEGIDTVFSALSYALTANVENLLLTGADALEGTGNALNNQLSGNGRNNVLTAAEGDDTLNGGAGNDTMRGGKGNDLYYVDSSTDVITEQLGQGTDSVISSSSYGLQANIENLTLVGTNNINAFGNSLDNFLLGNDGINILRGYAGNDTLDGGEGQDVFYGGLGDDVYIIDRIPEQIFENSNEGNDTVRTQVSYTLSDNVENIELTGVLNSAATGNSANNLLTGNTGANQLDGKAGADTLIGGLGDDLYIVDNALDSVVELTNQGVDSVESSISYSLGTHVENLKLTGIQNINGVGNELANRLIGNSGNNQLSGGAGDDFFVASAGNDTLNGGEGIDTVSYYGSLSEMVINLATGVVTATINGSQDALSGIENVIGSNFGDDMQGNAGDNVFIGQGGNDTIRGGGGFDTVSYATSITQGLKVSLATIGDFEQVLEAYGEGQAWLVGRDALFGINGVIGSDASDEITGSHGENRLSGGKGDDLIDGGVGYLTTSLYFDGYDYIEETVYIKDGDDWLEGGLGNDILYGGDGQDTASYARANAAVDVNLTLHSATGGDGSDKLYDIENIDGSAFADNLTGDATNNALSGAAGNDTLLGKEGNDSLSGGDGDDILVGGDGADLLMGGAANDTLTGNNGNDTLQGGFGADVMVGGSGDDTYQVDNFADVVIEANDQGIDTVQATASYGLLANFEKLELLGTVNSNGFGNALNNTLVGNGGNNLLDGALGTDTLIGGLGNDTYVLDNVADVIIEWDGAGNDTVRVGFSYSLVNTYLESVVLSGTSNINATGNSTNNWLTGNSGNNLLDGGAESDIMMGGAGDDTYIVDHQYDAVIEYGNQGIDTVKSSVRFDAVGRDIENIILTGTDNIEAIGNALKNLIIGNSGNNTLNGNLGMDTLQGGLGDDTYVVDSALDVIVEAIGEGTDSVNSSVSYSITGADVENLALTGLYNINAMGNSLNNLIVGNSANNSLDGGTGADTLKGGLGNDTYIVNSADDVVVELLTQGVDVVKAAINYTLTANVEQLILLGTDDLSANGNALNNTVTGNSGNNTLNGNQGADSLKGGLGDDRYYVDNVNDKVFELANEGNDSIYSSVSFSIEGQFVESLTLTGNDNTNAIGNALNNIITGNAGNNVLFGGAGADNLNGGLGNDTYYFNRASAQDVIYDNDTTVGNTDVLNVLTGVAIDQLWFKHVGNSLEVSIIGTNNKMLVQDWYAGAAKHIEQVHVVDGNKVLLDGKVENLVTAMAAITPPPFGQTTLTTQQHNQLDSVIAANWS